MNKSSSSTYSSPTPPPPSASQRTDAQDQPLSANTLRIIGSAITRHSRSPSIIPLEYNYKTMSPTMSTFLQQRRESSAYHLTDSQLPRPPDLEMEYEQYSSLFGDPVPPASSQEYLKPQRLLRTNFHDMSSEDDAFGERTGMLGKRLFSETPYSSSLVRRISDMSSASRNVELETPPSIQLPRLQPPDIQILPHSSPSSSEAQFTPNYSLLTPDDVMRRPLSIDIEEPMDVSEITETLTIIEPTGMRKYSEAVKRVTNFTEDFKSNVGTFGNRQRSEEMDTTRQVPIPRQISNESYSSSEWFRPTTHEFPEFSKIPRLRPSSKNVMSIKRDEMSMHSPVATMLNDSNESSSGEEQRRLNTTQVLEHPTVPLDSLTPPQRPPDPSPTTLHDLQAAILFSPEEDISLNPCHKCSMDYCCCTNFSPESLTSAPPIPPAPAFDDKSDSEEVKSTTRLMSPAIITDCITTGGEFRVEQPRLHKKTSFTIISPKSPQSSRTHSPAMTPKHHPTSVIREPNTTTSTSSGKPVPSPRHKLQQKSLSTTQLKLPHLTPYGQMTSDESPRPSVQFNMTGRKTPTKVPQKGILHYYRDSLTSSQDTILPQRTVQHPSALPTIELSGVKRVKSYDPLPFVTDPYRSAIPRLTPFQLDDGMETVVIPPGPLPRPLKPNPNPTRQQRGLLRVINSADSTSRIPLRSNWTSLDDIAIVQRPKTSLSPLRLEKRRRSSSTSPERRSSTQTASDRRSSNLSTITTSDISFRRPSIPPIAQRRKSLYPTTSPRTARKQSLMPIAPRTSRNKISKPSVLSPIIGTPNKDSSSTPQTPKKTSPSKKSFESEMMSDSSSRRASLSKIPVRSDSRSGSRMHSRSNSPLKEFNAELLSDLSSQMEQHRSPSRATSKSMSQPASRVPSRGPSRSTSRASTRPISRGPSRANSRPNSRMEFAKDIANSRSNSRLKTRSPIENMKEANRRVGRSKHPQQAHRRKSVSLSPQNNRRLTSSLMRRHSLSPVNKKRVTNKSASGSGGKQKRSDSFSRIPLFSKNNIKSGNKMMGKEQTTKSPREQKKSSPTRKVKESASAKKAQTSAQKMKSSVKRTASAVTKPATTKKQPSNLIRNGSSRNKKDEKKVTKTTRNESPGKMPRREGTQSSIRKTSATVTAAKRIASAKTNSKETPSKTKANKTQTKHDGKVMEEQKNTTTPQKHISKSVNVAQTPTKSAVEQQTGTPKATPTRGGVMKRSPSSLTLVRMGSTLSLLSKRGRSELSIKSPIKEASTEGTSDQEADGKTSPSKNINLIPITTAAITAQPVELAPAVASQLHKVNSSGQIIIPEDVSAAILEKSQKTLESVQKTVTEATDEIHKAIKENLTDLRSLETDVGELLAESLTSPSSSIQTVVENKAAAGKMGESASRLGTTESMMMPNTHGQMAAAHPTQPIEASVSVINAGGASGSTAAANNEKMKVNSIGGRAAETMERVSARAISVLPEVDCESANFQKYEYHTDEKTLAEGRKDAGHHSGDELKRRSPDGQGGSTADSGPDNNGSREFLKATNDDDDDDVGLAGNNGNGNGNISKRAGCCTCCLRFCMPCRRSRCLTCCSRRKQPNRMKLNDDIVQPVLSATSSTTTTNLEIIDEINKTSTSATTAAAVAANKKTNKTSCWQKLNCCGNCCKRKSKTNQMVPAAAAAAAKTMPAKQNKCGLCLSKVFCCRSVNRVDTTTGDETEVKKCCFCIPCRRKKANAVPPTTTATTSAAWQDPERGITASDASVVEGATAAMPTQNVGCCKRFWSKLLCCCRKQPPPGRKDSRRASMKAPTPVEEARKKLHNDLVEYSSKMKAAIPVLPLSLAWFCVICNTIVPGLGTLLSGFFCVCIGIPRFSQYDSAKARFGSFIINIIVAVAQLFCVLFCFVGWGWSIWWGTIMLKCARKLSKIRKVERLEMEEEKRQAAAATATAATGATATTHVEHETTKT